MPSPNHQTLMTDGPDVVSRAALHGGTTTIIDFAAWQQGERMADTIKRRMPSGSAAATATSAST